MPLDFRDKTIVKVDPESVETVKVKNSDGEFTLKRVPVGNWAVVVGGKTTEGDIPVVERLLNQFRDLKGESIVADPMPSAQPFGLDNPALEITLIGKDGKQLGMVKLAKISVKPTAPPIPGEPAQRTEYYATSSGSKAVYSLERFQLRATQPARAAVHGKGAAAATTASSRVSGEVDLYFLFPFPLGQRLGVRFPGFHHSLGDYVGYGLGGGVGDAQVKARDLFSLREGGGLAR